MGSGLGFLFLERLSVDYGEESKLSFTVSVCPQVATAAVETHNSVLCALSLLQHTDLAVLMDNKRLCMTSATVTWTSSAKKAATPCSLQLTERMSGTSMATPHNFNQSRVGGLISKSSKHLICMGLALLARCSYTKGSSESKSSAIRTSDFDDLSDKESGAFSTWRFQHGEGEGKRHCLSKVCL